MKCISGVPNPIDSVSPVKIKNGLNIKKNTNKWMIIDTILLPTQILTYTNF